MRVSCRHILRTRLYSVSVCFDCQRRNGGTRAQVGRERAARATAAYRTTRSLSHLQVSTAQGAKSSLDSMTFDLDALVVMRPLGLYIY